MKTKLEKKVRQLEKQVKRAEENGALISLSGPFGEVVVHCNKKTEEVAQIAVGLSRFLEAQRLNQVKHGRKEVH